jgi:hypothetical protein
MSDNLPKKLAPKPGDMLDATYQATIEAFTGAADMDKGALLVSIGRILQKTRSIGFIGALKSEFDELRAKGRIKEDYLGTDQHLTCMQEILDALDAELVDQTRFDFMKKVFLVAASEVDSGREDILPQQLMRLA